MKIKIPITVDVSGEMPVKQYITAKCADNMSRILQISLINRGCLLDIPKNSVVVLRCAKPDYTYTESFGRVEGGRAEFELSAQTLAVTGCVKCEVQVMSGDGESILTSSAFEIHVLPSVIPADAFESSDEPLSLPELVKALKVVGYKTDNDGEVFNDYEKNMAISPFSATFGNDCLAGSRAFTIIGLDISNKTYILDSAEGLEIGDVYSVHLYSQVENYGKITEINGNRVTVDKFFADRGVLNTTDEAIREDGFDAEKNTFRIIKKPHVGTRKIGCATISAGESNKVLSKGGISCGARNEVPGSYAAAFGRDHYAAYCSLVAGALNTIYGFTCFGAGQGNTINHNVWSSAVIGSGLISSGSSQLVCGAYNIPDTDKVLIAGNGTNGSNRSNAFTVDRKGDGVFAGDVYANGGDKLLTSRYVGSWAVTSFISGISAAFSVELDFPVVYDNWRIYVEGNDLSGAIAKGENFVTAPVIFDNEDIVVSFERNDETVLSTRLVKLNEVGKIKYGKLVPEVEEDE